MDRDKEGEVVKQNLLQDYLSGEKDKEKNQRSQDQHPGQVNWSGESEIDEEIPDERQDPENKVYPGSSGGCEESTDMIWRSVQSPAQPLRRMMLPETQEWTPIQTGTRVRDPNCQNWRYTRY